MANFNKVFLMGNLTRDPELRFTPKGLAIAKLGLAVNRVWRDESGQTKEEVTFVDIDAFGKQAETLGQYVKKGSPIFIEGRLRLDSWEDKQTKQKRNRLGVVLESFQFLDFGRKGMEDPAAVAQRNNPPPAAAAPAAPAPASPAGEDSPAEDDVPF